MTHRRTFLQKRVTVAEIAESSTHHQRTYTRSRQTSVHPIPHHIRACRVLFQFQVRQEP